VRNFSDRVWGDFSDPYHEHRVELDRLDMLDRHIDLTQRLEHVAARELERGLERSVGLEL